SWPARLLAGHQERHCSRVAVVAPAGQHGSIPRTDDGRAARPWRGAAARVAERGERALPPPGGSRPLPVGSARGAWEWCAAWRSRQAFLQENLAMVEGGVADWRDCCCTPIAGAFC